MLILERVKLRSPEGRITAYKNEGIPSDGRAFIPLSSAHKDRLYLLARDVGNPSHRDPDFPVVRHQDYYNGFSWASGVAPGERQEESASEVRGVLLPLM